MAQLLLIDTGTYYPPGDEMDDISGVFDDTHKFSEHELEIFKVVTVKGKRADVVAKLQSLLPEQARIFQSTKTLLWSFQKPELREIKDKRDIWKKGGLWYYLENGLKHSFTIKDLTTIEKDLLKTTDVSSISNAKDAAYNKIYKPFEDKIENNTEVPTGITATEIS